MYISMVFLITDKILRKKRDWYVGYNVTAIYQRDLFFGSY